jgi:hypothetical protein
MGAMDAKTAGVSLTTLIRAELGLALAVVGLLLWLTSWVRGQVALAPFPLPPSLPSSLPPSLPPVPPAPKAHAPLWTGWDDQCVAWGM